MKTSAIIIAILFFSVSIQAQNKNVENTTKTTVTTVKVGDKVKKFVKKENVVKVQDIQLKDAKANTKNIEMKNSPVSVTSTTQITNPDGSTRTTSIDRSGYYMFNDTKYKVNLDPQGYTFNTEGLTKPYLLRKTSTNSFIYFNDGKVSVSYFDTDGNLIVETYNDQTDLVEYKKFILVKE